MTPRYLASALAVAAACALALGPAESPARSLAAPSAPAVQPPAAPTLDPDEIRRKGIDWLLERQAADGGWGAGSHGRDAEAQSDVATTVVGIMALLRDAGAGDRHADALRRATVFVVEAVENAPEGPRLATPANTQPQYKLGSLVDTHFAALILGDLAPRFGDDLRPRVNRAWDKVLGKVQQAQADDGSFANDGWAPVLSGSFAAQSLMKAKASGRVVDEDVLEKSARYQASQVSGEGTFDTSKAAGVELYSVAGTLRANAQAAAGGEAPEAEEAARKARTRVAADASGALMNGFGSVGGEEMLAYMMISDTLAQAGGDEWSSWETKISGYLSGIQNADGSWSGHHCITSTTFVTATALMTLGAGDHAQQQAARATGDEPRSL